MSEKKPEKIIRVQCLKTFNLDGYPESFKEGSIADLPESKIKFLVDLGVRNQPFIKILDKAAETAILPEPAPAVNPAWIQTKRGGSEDEIVPRQSVTQTVRETPKPVEIEEKTGVPDEDAPKETEEPARKLNLKKKN